MRAGSIQEMICIAVLLCWATFIVGFLIRKRSPAQTEHKRSTIATVGLLLEAAGYALVWFVRREWNTAFIPLGPLFETIIALLTITLAISSVWIILSAITVLGKQWTPAARIIEHHQLVTAGPYKIVRHPIYAGLLGLIVATGVAFSQPWVLLPAVSAYLAGTVIRITMEEKLLLGYFGDEYTEYKRKVAALIPHIF
jgi:protein-S-isoprenylcysteine O-methyltransferase Ste14